MQRLGTYFYRRRALYAAVTLVLAAGVLFGAIAAMSADEGARADLDRHVGQLVTTSTVLPDPVVVLRSAFVGPGGALYVIGTIAVLGLSIIGAPLALAVLFWRGFTFGFATGFVVQGHAWRGALLVMAGLVPRHSLLFPALIVATASSLGFAGQSLKVLFGSRPGTMRGPAAKTVVMWTGSAVLLLLASLLEAYVTPTLLDWVRTGLF